MVCKCCLNSSTVEVNLYKRFYFRCNNCKAWLLPNSELLYDNVEPDTGKIPKIMYILFSLRFIWLSFTINELKIKDSKILDFGCGDGQFTSYLRKRGYTNIKGVEVNPKRLINAKKFGVDVYPSIEECNTDKFDIVFLWHVLEHLPAPHETVTKILNYLNENGILIISVPNHDSFQSKIFNKFWAYLDYGRHLWYFSDEYFENLPDTYSNFFIDSERLIDLNFEYEIFGWVDSIASYIMKTNNFVLNSVKKGQGSIGIKTLAIFFIIIFLPFTVFFSFISILTQKYGSTLTFKISKNKT